MAKLLGYVRVSSNSQKNNESPELQEKQIKAYCEAFNHELVGIYRDATSGKTLKRKGIQELLKEVESKDIDGVIVAKIDRLARNTIEGLTLADSLTKKDKVLVSIDLNIDITTAIGRYMLTQLFSFAELEVAKINERTAEAKAEVKKRGGYCGGSPAYGKKAVKELQGEKIVKKLVDNEQEKEVIDIIRRHRRSGKSNQKIADYLNQDTNKYPPKRADRWNRMQVKRILDGFKRFNKIGS